MHTIAKAHESPIYTMKHLDEHLLIAGDDDGTVKVWDCRTGKSVYDAQEQKESSITDLAFSSDRTHLLSTCTNGTLAVYDLRKENTSKDKLMALSDEMEEELNCVQIIRVI